MRFSSLSVALGLASAVLAVPQKRDDSQFHVGQPISADGKGAPIVGGTDNAVDRQNPSNLGEQSTDGGTVPNLKWRFSDSKTRIYNGGWTRQQVKSDLPQSNDIAAAQQHLTKGGIRELHWHRVAEWGFVYSGEVLVSAVDEDGRYVNEKLSFGDIWYFPKGAAHTVQGLDDENEFLLVFDDGNFDRAGTTFNIVDWLKHTPRDIVAKNFGVDAAVFDKLGPPPNILNGTVATKNVTAEDDRYLSGNASFIYRTLQHEPEEVPGDGGNFWIIDSKNFPAAKTIAATFVTLKPGGLRELHWHPNAEEWLYFHAGQARATVFTGNGNARTFDFHPGDTAVFPDNSGHYIENTSETEDLVWIEIYKSDRVADIPLTQWLALTPPEVAAQTLQVPVEFIESLKKEKQILLP
ncbi:oxalate decarboxylase oxdD [Plectosphaerella plurivora]|uniref:Oxalate decarboxylase oxdD n=1 Tax=Plectosphaerella plurivora TaxID=936078 RepID=A0A9P9A919_9PEZI|nr:oxalate decarboxylase oxdD [Plectosphaerella plurivora]